MNFTIFSTLVFLISRLIEPKEQVFRACFPGLYFPKFDQIAICYMNNTKKI